MDEPLLWLGLVACAALAAGAVLPLPRQARLALLTAALILAPTIVGADNWSNDQVVELRDSPALLAVAALAGGIGLALLSRLFLARPTLLPLALVATLPFRIPVDFGSSSSNLLLPLYAVLAAGLLAAWLRPERMLPRGLPDRGPVALLGWALAAYLLFYGLQAGYADDLSAAIENTGFFLVPFAALFFLLASVEWDTSLLRKLVLVLALEALIVAIVAFGQYALGEIFWNDKVEAGNEAHAWFRVNSLFFDPNIMGRYLAVTMVVLAGVAAWAAQRAALLATAVFVVLALALGLSFSQSSLLALLAGLLTLGLARWGAVRGTVAAVAVACLLVLSIVAISSGSGDLAEETTGRSGLVSGGLELAGDRPLAGYGSGSFPDEFKARFGGGEEIAVVSHTEPITVGAEQGLIGFVPYVAVVLISAWILLSAAGLGLGPTPRALAATVLAAYVVMLVHSLGYAAFFIDPITWALFAFATVVGAAARPEG